MDRMREAVDHLELTEERSDGFVNDVRRSASRNPKPSLTQNERDQIMHVLVESLGIRNLVKLHVYHEFEDCFVIGVVDKIDPYTRSFSVDGEWFSIADITYAESKP